MHSTSRDTRLCTSQQTPSSMSSSPEERAGGSGLAAGRLPSEAGALRAARGVRWGLGGEGLAGAERRAVKRAVSRLEAACWAASLK